MINILEPEIQCTFEPEIQYNAMMLVAEVADDSGNLKNIVFPGIDTENLEW